MVSLVKEKQKVRFCVSDTGIGISEDDLPKIWERFYQIDKSRTFSENGSCGLGLPMVKWIADAHNGILEVTSDIGVGSTFTFEFSAHKS